MEKKILDSLRKMSTVELTKKLNKGIFEGEKRLAAISVLKQRGKDVTGYEIVREVEVEDIIESEIAEEGLQRQAQSVIDSIVEENNESLNLEAGEIIGDTEDGRFTVEQVGKLLELKNKIKKKEDTKKDPSMEKFPESVQKRKRRMREVEIPDSLRGCVTEILALPVQKKEKIIKLSKAGLTRKQILGLNFVDPTYIYDLFKLLNL